ncbi:hypothetical protein ANMWB30_24650 [Arthrobacter sp. MWB30]|nr:hypothetical protein ANMWB30_24650 [Arthrobacter sp. MWB30]
MVRLAQEHGWSFGVTSSGHPRLRPPPEAKAEAVVFSNTPSDTRSDKNSIARLRRAGVPVPHR